LKNEQMTDHTTSQTGTDLSTASTPLPKALWINSYGLAGFIYPANDTDSSDLITEAREVTLVFNDMRLWLPGPRGTGRHLDAIQKRLDQGRRTRIFLLHPKSPFISEVARASGKDPQEQIDELERAVTRICNTNSRWGKAIPKNTLFEQRPLQIIGHPRYNTYSMIMTEEEARVNYYPIGFRGKEDVGHFHVYKPTAPDGIFERLVRDLDVIKAIAENAFKEEMDLVQYYHPVRLRKTVRRTNVATAPAQNAIAGYDPEPDVDARQAFFTILENSQWRHRQEQSRPDPMTSRQDWLNIRLSSDIHNALVQGKLTAWGELNLARGTGPLGQIPADKWHEIEIEFDPLNQFPRTLARLRNDTTKVVYHGVMFSTAEIYRRFPIVE
jgi:hypothetical protein